MPLSPIRLRLLVAALLTVAFLGALDHTVVATSLATIAGELGALEHMSWIVVGYTLASTVMMPVLGKLGDIVGPRAVFLVSLVVFLVASLVCGWAPDMGWLIVARLVQGMSSSGLQLMSQTIIAQVTTPRERPRYMAVIGAAFPIAILLGPVLGGAITDYWGWPWAFWITFAVAFVSLVLAVTWIGDPAARVPSIIAFAAAAGGFVAFFLVERRAEEPIVPLRLFANRTISAGVALSAIIGIGLFSITAYLPTYFQMAYRTSATVSGLVPIATVFGMLLTNLLSGFLVSRTGHYRVYPIAGTALAATGLAVMSLLPVGLPLWVPMAVMFVVGVGTGAFMSLVIAVVQSAAPRRDTGAITATVNLVRQIGSTVTTAVIGGVVGFGVAGLLPAGMDAATLTPQLVHAAPADAQAQIAGIYRDVFAPVFVALAVVYAIGVVAAILLPHGRLSDDHEQSPAPPTSRIPASDTAA